MAAASMSTCPTRIRAWIQMKRPAPECAAAAQSRTSCTTTLPVFCTPARDGNCVRAPHRSRSSSCFAHRCRSGSRSSRSGRHACCCHGGASAARCCTQATCLVSEQPASTDLPALSCSRSRGPRPRPGVRRRLCARTHTGDKAPRSADTHRPAGPRVRRLCRAGPGHARVRPSAPTVHCMC